MLLHLSNIVCVLLVFFRSFSLPLSSLQAFLFASSSVLVPLLSRVPLCGLCFKKLYSGKRVYISGFYLILQQKTTVFLFCITCAQQKRVKRPQRSNNNIARLRSRVCGGVEGSWGGGGGGQPVTPPHREASHSRPRWSPSLRPLPQQQQQPCPHASSWPAAARAPHASPSAPSRAHAAPQGQAAES